MYATALARALAAAVGVVLAATSVASGAAGGDPAVGEALFVGTARLANGGAPCLACHGVAGHGLARAASFGPDLSTVYASYGEAALAATLEDVPFPSMQPIYAKHALTAPERAHLTAFLHGASGGAAPRLGAGYAAGVAGAAAAFAALVFIVGRRAWRPARREGRP